MNFDSAILLKPIAGESPAGMPLPGIDRREIEMALKEDLSGAAEGGTVIRAQPRVAAEKAVKALRDSKDLDVAVLLTEALVRLDGFDGLRRGLDLIRQLLAAFWDTIYPLIEDGDEELRAAPIKRLAGTAFRSSMGQIPITKDGYTDLDRLILKNIPLAAEAAGDSDKAVLRRDAETKKRVLPEQFSRSLSETSFVFYEQMASDAVAARESLVLLEEECRAKFKDSLVLQDVMMQFTALAGLFGQYEALADEMMRLKAPAQAPPPEPEPAGVVVDSSPAPEPPPTVVPPPEPDAQSAAPDAPEPAAWEPTCETDIARCVFAAARALRRENPANPVAFLLPRCWHFGNVIGSGSLDETVLVPPSAELRTDLWRLYRERNWQELLARAEDALESDCGKGWLDLHYYSGLALEQLGEAYEATRTLTEGLLRLYLTRVPDLAGKQLADGTPCACPDAARWLERLTSRSEEPPRVERPVPPDPAQSEANDFFGEAVGLAEAGRIGAALESFYRARQPADTGKARFETNTRAAQLCIAAGEHALAVPILRALRDEIDRRRLHEWDPDLAARVLAMLYESLRAAEAKEDEIAQVYSGICVIDPLLALKLRDRA